MCGAVAMALYSSYLMTFFFSAILFRQQFLFFFGGPLKKIPPKFGEPLRLCSSLLLNEPFEKFHETQSLGQEF
jgi:hypothetical protein